MALALVCAGCTPASAPTPLELRALARPGDPHATPFTTEQGALYLDEPLTVEITRWYSIADPGGPPRIGAEVAEGSREAIDSFSFAHRGEQVALIAGGQLIAVPTLNGRIVSTIQIQGEFDDAEAQRLVDLLNKR